MGKRSRPKQNGKPVGAVMKNKKELLKMATDLFKLCVQTTNPQEELEYYLKLHAAVKEFDLKQKSVNPKPAVKVDRLVAMETFKDWLKENGVVWNKIELFDSEGVQGFGFQAKEDIEMKSLLMTVPRHIMIGYEEARKSYLADLIAGNDFLTAMPNVCLALYLHCEKFSPNSKYKPYIDVLPEDYNTVLYFEPDELKHLKGSTCISSAINQFKSIARQFTLLYQVFNTNHLKSDVEKIPALALESFSFDAYRWCVSAVTTRQNKIPTNSLKIGLSEDPNSSLALIPFWDMFNHSAGPLSTTYNVTNQTIECFSMQDFKVGEEVTICYGGRPNSDLLVHNGFVVDKNPFDKVKINLGVSSSDPLYARRVQLLKLLSLPSSGQFAICAMNGNLPTSPQLLTFLRVFHMDEEELAEWLKRDVQDLSKLREIYLSGPVLFKGDVKMWKFLETRATLLLKSMEKNIDGDLETMVKDESLSHHTRLCLQLRYEEQRVLSACVVFCREFRSSLQEQEKIRESALKTVEDDVSPEEKLAALTDLMYGNSHNEKAKDNDTKAAKVENVAENYQEIVKNTSNTEINSNLVEKLDSVKLENSATIKDEATS